MATLYFGTTLINQAEANVATVVESLTQAEYEALAVKDPNTLYVLTDVKNIDEAFDLHVADKDNPHGVTAAQVGAPTVEEMNEAIAAIPTPDVSGQINDHNADTSAHADIRTAVNNAANAANNAAAAAAEAKTTANGKEAAGTAANKVSAHNTDTAAHSDIRTAVTNAANAASAAQAAATNAQNTANSKAPMYQYSTTDLTAGSSSLTTGTLYFVYE